MRHEALPHHEHRRTNQQFWRLLVPEIRFPAFRAMNTMLADGTLRQSSATRLLRDLWNTPDEYFDDTTRNWRAKPVE